ncbi:hypothetical protein ACFL5Z_16525 [Planctomycetota bacterium]
MSELSVLTTRTATTIQYHPHNVAWKYVKKGSAFCGGGPHQGNRLIFTRLENPSRRAIVTPTMGEYTTSKSIKIEYSDAIGSAEGVSAGGVIKLKKGLTAAEEFSVLAHEAAHEIIHNCRDNMPKDKKVRETEAEAVAFVVCHGIGLDVNTASSDYIQLYDGDK